MFKNFLNQPNVIGRLMIVLFFVGGMVYAGAFGGFVVETEAASCCGGGTDASTFSSSECCDEDECTICGCKIAGCFDCEIISSCPKDCSCVTDEVPGPCAEAPGVCSTSTDDKYLCNNDCR